MRFVKLVLAGLTLTMAAVPVAWAEEAGSDGAPSEAAPPTAVVEESVAPAAPATEVAESPDAESSDTMESAAVTEAPAQSDAPAAAEAPAPAEVVAAESAPPTLGPVGYDAKGRRGRVHVVVHGDTLWDISDAYLGTPWVWPSIWTDNREIKNPHLIRPGDRIWITPSEMRRVTEAEAEALLAGSPAKEEEVSDTAPPAAPEEVPEAAQVVVVSSSGSTGFVSDEEIESAGSIIEADELRTIFGNGDHVYIGLGEGEVEPHDQLSIVRIEEPVTDPDSGKRIGYHVQNLGWLEVDVVHPETSEAWIRLSIREIELGDRLIKRRALPTRIEVRESPRQVEGAVSFFADSRTVMGSVDFVYLNRGTLDGLEVGSPLEIYSAGYDKRDRVRGEDVELPDRVSARMLVVDAEPQTAVAFVTVTNTEIQVGDRFRGATP